MGALGWEEEGISTHRTLSKLLLLSSKGFHCPFNKSKNDYTLLCHKPTFLKQDRE